MRNSRSCHLSIDIVRFQELLKNFLRCGLRTIGRDRDTISLHQLLQQNNDLLLHRTQDLLHIPNNRATVCLCHVWLWLIHSAWLICGQSLKLAAFVSVRVVSWIGCPTPAVRTIHEFSLNHTQMSRSLSLTPWDSDGLAIQQLLCQSAWNHEPNSLPPTFTSARPYSYHSSIRPVAQ